MHPRIVEEWADILSLHPEAKYVAAPDRVETSIALPPGMYSIPRTRVAVLVPPGYRTTGLDGFVIPSGLRLANGAPMPVSDASPLGLPGWELVSFHYIDAAGRSTWRASADPRQGDNVILYIASIEAFLAGGCV